MGNTGIIFKGSTKYGVAERLGNYIDPKSELMNKFTSIDVHGYVLCPELYYHIISSFRYKGDCLGSPSYSNKYEGDFVKYPRKEGCTVCNFVLSIFKISYW